MMWWELFPINIMDMVERASDGKRGFLIGYSTCTTSNATWDIRLRKWLTRKYIIVYDDYIDYGDGNIREEKLFRWEIAKR